MSLLVKYLAIFALMFTCISQALGAADAVGEALAQRIQGLTETSEATIGDIPVLAGPLLADFYARRDLRPAWTRDAQVDELLEILGEAGGDGLDPDDYLVDELTTLRRESTATGDAFAAADLDILLTESLVRYGFNQKFGKVNNRKFDQNINFRRELDDGEEPVETIQEAIDSPSLSDFLAKHFPRGALYLTLRDALRTYREFAAAGGWEATTAGPTLHEGDTDSRVASIRRRLAATGDMPDGAPTVGEEFDAVLAAGVRNFQERHALDVDGAVGPATLAALNVPVAQRIDELRLSLERLRWVSGELADEFVAVNIAGFRAFYVREGRIDWATRAMVGKSYRQTPVFRGDIRYLVLNPTWTIPPGILRKDVLPAIKRDVNYLTERNISVIDRDGRKVDPATVDWNRYTTGVPYTLRQEPGPNNALGTIKFIFPNEHFVFLHDTPSRYLFDRAERAFSSGCIRVEDPLRLAELLLGEPDKWDRQALESKIDGGVLERVNLREPMPVLILYLTASMETDGRVRFLKDIYQRDAKLLEALNAGIEIAPPGAT